MLRRPALALVFAFAGCRSAAPSDPPATAPSPSAPASSAAPADPAAAREQRLARVVDATIRATHARHILLARRSGKGDPICYSAGGRDEASLEAMVAQQKAMFTGGTTPLETYVDTGHGGVESPVEAILANGPEPPATTPFAVMEARLREAGASGLRARAVASLFQIVLEVDRDGDILQDAISAYDALGLPVYLQMLGLPSSDGDFLALGRVLSARTCAAPYPVTAEAWQISARKLQSWGEKKLRIRDGAVIAEEMRAEAGVQELLPRLRALPPRTISVIGHSFTMEVHWSTPGTFMQIAKAILARESPQTKLIHHFAGGMGAAKAESMFLQAVLAEKPDAALLVVGTRTDEDRAALTRMGEALGKAHIEAYMFDDLLIGNAPDRPEAAQKVAAAARAGGIRVIAVRDILAAAPDRDGFLCLDGIHMKEPYHRRLAREWLRFLAGARGRI